MSSRCAFGTHQEKKKLNGLPIERVKVDGVWSDASHEHELVDVWRLSVWNCDSPTYTRAQYLLAFVHGREHGLHRTGVPACGRELNQLTEHVIFRSAAERDFDAVHGEQLSQQHVRSTNLGLKG